MNSHGTLWDTFSSNRRTVCAGFARWRIKGGMCCLVAVILLLTFPVRAETLSCRVVSIADGDTLTVLDVSLQQHKIRLAWILL